MHQTSATSGRWAGAARGYVAHRPPRVAGAVGASAADKETPRVPTRIRPPPLTRSAPPSSLPPPPTPPLPLPPRDPEPFDWYQRFSGVKDLVAQYVKKTDHIMNIGCGNSRMSEDMYDEGYTTIANIDISKVRQGR